jgi:hypothetical protein
LESSHGLIIQVETSEGNKFFLVYHPFQFVNQNQILTMGTEMVPEKSIILSQPIDTADNPLQLA